MPEPQAQALKFRPVALYHGMSIVKVRSVCETPIEAALMVTQTDSMAPTISVLAYIPEQGVEMQMADCFGTPAAVEHFLKNATSSNKRAKH